MNVEETHEHEHQGNQTEDDLRAHIALGPRKFGLIGRGLAQIGEGPAQTHGEALVHLDQRVCSAHKHSTHRDRPHDESPDCDGHSGPVIGRVCGQVLFELRPH